MNSTVSVTSRQQRKTNWLPLLVFLFVVSWGSLTTLVVLQDRMIDAQADVIHSLLKESRLKSVLAAQKLSAPKPHSAQSIRNQNSSKNQKEFSSVSPSDQVHSKESAARIPSSQAKAQNHAKPDRNRNAGKRSPFSHPPAEMTDPSDMRRTVFSI